MQHECLRELLKKGLHQENLDHLVACCSGLAQDSSYVLPFFVLKNIFREMRFSVTGSRSGLGRKTPC